MTGIFSVSVTHDKWALYQVMEEKLNTPQRKLEVDMDSS